MRSRKLFSLPFVLCLLGLLPTTEAGESKLPPKMRVVNGFDMGQPIDHARGACVTIKDKRHLLVKYTASVRIDPWQEAYCFHTDSYKLALLDLQANKVLWKKDLGMGIPTGDWFCPVLSFDLDADGEDEIFYIDNERPKFPLSLRRSLVGLRARDGKEFLRFPVQVTRGNMSETYRFVLIGGKNTKGEPVLVMQNGTYSFMDFFAYDKNGKAIWSRSIPADGTPRASHCSSVYDFNGDGGDELLWGERMISLSTGKDLFVCTGDGWDGHSDIVMPVFDRDLKFCGFWTCRESGMTQGHPEQFRCNFYDGKGKLLWGKFKNGHMDMGGVLRYNAAGDKAVYSVEMGVDAKTLRRGFQPARFFDLKGNELKYDLPGYRPPRTIDVDGDGCHELEIGGIVYDLKGKPLCLTQGGRTFVGHIRNDLPGEQFVRATKAGQILVLADPNAKWSEAAKQRYAHPYYESCMRNYAVGYNFGYDLGGI